MLHDINGGCICSRRLVSQYQRMMYNLLPKYSNYGKAGDECLQERML